MLMHKLLSQAGPPKRPCPVPHESSQRSTCQISLRLKSSLLPLLPKQLQEQHQECSQQQQCQELAKQVLGSSHLPGVAALTVVPGHEVVRPAARPLDCLCCTLYCACPTRRWGLFIHCLSYLYYTREEPGLGLQTLCRTESAWHLQADRKGR